MNDPIRKMLAAEENRGVDMVPGDLVRNIVLEDIPEDQVPRRHRAAAPEKRVTHIANSVQLLSDVLDAVYLAPTPKTRTGSLVGFPLEIRVSLEVTFRCSSHSSWVPAKLGDSHLKRR